MCNSCTLKALCQSLVLVCALSRLCGNYACYAKCSEVQQTRVSNSSTTCEPQLTTGSKCTIFVYTLGVVSCLLQQWSILSDTTFTQALYALHNVHLCCQRYCQSLECNRSQSASMLAHVQGMSMWRQHTCLKVFCNTSTTPHG
jgi:hypothetical protein